MFKFIHAADIHLDSPLKGLEQYEGAPADEIRGATRRALENLVDLALRESVDFVLLAGDLYDGDWKDHNTGLFFVAQMARLREANIPVVAISGNHDAANKMTKSLRLPDNVELLPPARPSTARSPALAALWNSVRRFPNASSCSMSTSGRTAMPLPSRAACCISAASRTSTPTPTSISAPLTRCVRARACRRSTTTWR